MKGSHSVLVLGAERGQEQLSHADQALPCPALEG